MTLRIVGILAAVSITSTISASSFAQELSTEEAINALAVTLTEAGEKALEAIKEAIKLSPFSLPRHFKACEIGRQNDDLILAATSSQAIWDLSKRTVNKKSLHWCGIIRSLLDVAEFAEDTSVWISGAYLGFFEIPAKFCETSGKAP